MHVAFKKSRPGVDASIDLHKLGNTYDEGELVFSIVAMVNLIKPGANEINHHLRHYEGHIASCQIS